MPLKATIMGNLQTGIRVVGVTVVTTVVTTIVTVVAVVVRICHIVLVLSRVGSNTCIVRRQAV